MPPDYMWVFECLWTGVFPVGLSVWHNTFLRIFQNVVNDEDILSFGMKWIWQRCVLYATLAGSLIWRQVKIVVFCTLLYRTDCHRTSSVTHRRFLKVQFICTWVVNLLMDMSWILHWLTEHLSSSCRRSLCSNFMAFITRLLPPRDSKIQGLPGCEARMSLGAREDILLPLPQRVHEFVRGFK